MEAEVAEVETRESKDAMKWAGDVHTSVVVGLLLPGCSVEPYILAGQVGTTTAVEVRPGQPARVDFDGHFLKDPPGLRKACSEGSLVGTLATGHRLDGYVSAYFRRTGPHDSVEGPPTLVSLRGNVLDSVVSYLVDRSSSS